MKPLKSTRTLTILKEEDISMGFRGPECAKIVGIPLCSVCKHIAIEKNARYLEKGRKNICTEIAMIALMQNSAQMHFSFPSLLSFTQISLGISLKKAAKTTPHPRRGFIMPTLQITSERRWRPCAE